jgi:hypothetical protein
MMSSFPDLIVTLGCEGLVVAVASHPRMAMRIKIGREMSDSLVFAMGNIIGHGNNSANQMKDWLYLQNHFINNLKKFIITTPGTPTL